ncbi:ANTAR domain-containing protein [Actinorugispora endophytica]|uniref:ANTAR domain-containing protein n=1 Tax=Actinorugispora endophytica TaxID=1605990 RepID=A0A4R6V6B5_9ACTN|nr:ANTAR domain-containing protein [Actinorugispora endophytica]TDQ54722.1 ANTAR domain-containing protein [Actinorugispora endophytica]
MAGAGAGADLIRRTAGGWRVHSGDEELPDLLNAMVLADLLAAEDARAEPLAASPPRAGSEASELERLRVTVAQLEHALRTRVMVEQAIGVLSERHRLTPRTAFERLRHAARSRGRRVTDLAREVVTSTQNPLVALPEELARQGAATQLGRPRRVVE